MSSKTCTKCQETKLVEQFYRSKDSKDGRGWRCKLCTDTKREEWKRNNPDREKETQRRATERTFESRRARLLMKNYGLTVLAYDELLASQGGKCANNRCTNTDKLCVDHCHKTGKVRGLLCQGCNRGIGYMHDSPQRVLGAAEYLKSWDQCKVE